MKNYKDEELILLYRKGSEEAFNEIYNRYKNVVKYVSRKFYLLGAEDEDLIQEATLGLIKAVNGYEEGEASFKTYAITCIKTSVYTAVKKYAGNNFNALNFSVAYDRLDYLGIFVPSLDEDILSKENKSEAQNKIYSNLSKTEKEVIR